MEIYCIIWLFFLKVKTNEIRIRSKDAQVLAMFVFYLLTCLKSFIQDLSPARFVQPKLSVSNLEKEGPGE
jgi:hypothetical protein